MAALRYDRDGDEHYDVISAFIKSMRGSDVDAALHYLARMLVAGEDARFIARRMVIFASEDIGMADPTALRVATAAAHAVEFVGLPEVQLNLAQAVDPPGHRAQVQRGHHGDRRRAWPTSAPAMAARCRAHLRDAHYSGAPRLGHGKGLPLPTRRPPRCGPSSGTPRKGSTTGTTTGRAAMAASAPWRNGCRRLRRIVRGTTEPAAGPATDGVTSMVEERHR